MSEEPTKKIRMEVREECTYRIDIDIPADANPADWVSEYGEEYWTEVDDMNSHFKSCDDRSCSFVCSFVKGV